MAKRKKTTSERGKFKQTIHSALYKSEEIKELMLGDISKMKVAEITKAFKEQVNSHLFIDDTITETKSYIFYDVTFPWMHENTKECQIHMYILCHRDILDNYFKEGYYGNRADILLEMVEDALINDEEIVNKFGIGKLELDSVDVYNSRTLYGTYVVFRVPDFR